MQGFFKLNMNSLQGVQIRRDNNESLLPIRNLDENRI